MAEREISARLDGASDGPAGRQVEQHLAGCISCRSFAAAAEQIREAARLEVAPDIPEELLGSILQRIEQPAGGGPQRHLGRSALRPVRWRTLRPHAAAFLVGALAAALVVGGGVPRGPAPVLAREVSARLVEASTEVAAYSADYHVTERNFRPDVPERKFLTEVSYGGRERFRAVTRDLSDYPSARWPRNSVTLEVDEGRWRVDAPRSCPRQALPDCAQEGRRLRSVAGREPFDADAVLPSDMILPLRTLAGTRRVDVIGATPVGGRRSVQIRLAYRDALPLFAFLRAGGTWRPAFPTDVVTLSLDADNWFPLAYSVTVDDSEERLAWALSQGLGPEKPGSEIFDVRVRDIRYSNVKQPIGLSGGMEGVRDGGFIDLATKSLAEEAGYSPVTPADTAGLTAYRSGIYRDPGRKGEVLTSFSRGLGWIKIRQTPNWAQQALFGNVGPLAEKVETLGGGVAYYEPATESLGRRLSIHANGLDVYLETNLPARELLKVADSLPVKGITVPESWSVRTWPGGIVREVMTLDEAVRRIPYLRFPMKRPENYEVSAVYLVTTPAGEGATVFMKRPGMETDGRGLRVHQSPGTGLSPPIDSSVYQVKIGGVAARYSPTRGEIEWVEDGTYFSIGDTSVDLQGLKVMVMSMSASAREGDE